MRTYYVVYLFVIIAAILINRSDEYSFVDTTGRRIHNPPTKIVFTISCIFLVFVAGCRYQVGSDYGVYYSDYRWYAEVFFEKLKTLSEPGMYLLFKIASFIRDDPIVGIFICSAVTIILSLRVYYKYSDWLSLSLLLYVFVCWHTCFNGVRQGLAVAVFFCTFHSLEERNFKRFFTIVFLAFLFHRSVFPMVAIYFVTNRKVTKKNILLLFVVSFILLFSYSRIFSFMGVVMNKQEYFELYSETSTNYLSRSVNILRVVFEVFPAFFFLSKYNKITHDADVERIDFGINLLVIHAAVALATSGSAYMARMSLFTMPFAVISICRLLQGIKRNRGLFVLLFIILFGFFGWYEVGNSARLIPFRWIWDR